MTERWKSVPGFPGYEVSTEGRIRSTHNRWGELKTPRILRIGPNSQGYRTTILLDREGNRRTVKVHRLVLMAFVGPPPFPGAHGCHGDGDPAHNGCDNLRWDTRSKNSYAAVAPRTHVSSRKSHCARGHEYTPENARITPRGWRRCIECWGNS